MSLYLDRQGIFSGCLFSVIKLGVFKWQLSHAFYFFITRAHLFIRQTKLSKPKVLFTESINPKSQIGHFQVAVNLTMKARLKLSTYPRFHNEAQSNSEMANCLLRETGLDLG